MVEMSIFELCEDNSCCCIPPRTAVAIISAISLISSAVDMVLEDCRKTHEYVETLRVLLTTIFQIANLLLLLASYVENAILVQIYLWYSLAFVVMGLVVELLQFLLRVKVDGISRSCVRFVPEIAFHFAITQCLHIANIYRRDLEDRHRLNSDF